MSDIVRGLVAGNERTAVLPAMLGAAILILVALPLSAALNIWIDEAFTLHTTGAGPLAAWSQAVAFEDQPPFYFVLEATWRMWDETSIAFARLPSIFFAAAAVAIVVAAAKRIAPRTPSSVVVLLTAFNPVFLWAAVEMRVYALVLLIGAVLTWTFFEGFLVSRPSRRAQICYTIVAIIGLYTQYYIGFVLAAHCITLLTARRGSLAPFLRCMAIVLVSFAPFTRVALTQVASSGDSVVRTTFIGAFHQTADALFAYAAPHDPVWTGAFKLAGFGAAATFAVALVLLGRPSRPAAAVRAIALQWSIGVVLFSLIFTVVGIPLDLVRHLIVLAPATLLVVVLFMSSLRRMRGTACVLTCAVFAIFALTALWGQYHPPLAKQGDWQRVAAILSAAGQATPIAVFPAELVLPLRVYSPAPAIPIPRPMPFTLDYVRATTLMSEFDVSHALEPAAQRSQRVWIVTRDACEEPTPRSYDYNCRFLEDFLRRRYRLEKTVALRGVLLRRYVRMPLLSTHSRLAHSTSLGGTPS